MPVSDIMTNLAVSTITKTLTKQIIIKLMKITQFRRNEDTIALSVMDLDILVNKIKTEIKSRPRFLHSESICDIPFPMNGVCLPINFPK